MRGRLLRALVRAGGAALACLLAPGISLGAEQLQGVFRGAVGYTDNVRASPDEPVEDVPPKAGDLMLVASPSLVYAIAKSSHTHRLSYTITGNVFYDNNEASSFANRAEWFGFFDLAPNADLIVSAGATQNQTHTDTSAVDTATTAVRAALPGTSSFIVGQVGETLNYYPNPDWRATQSSGGSARTSLFGDPGPFAFRVTNRLGIERLWRTDAFGPEVRVDYSRIEDTLVPGQLTLTTEHYWWLEGLLRWRHDWGRSFVSRLEAGVLTVIQPTRDSTQIYPTGAAGLAYVPPEGTAELSFERSAQVNLVLGQTLLIDQATLRGGVPLDRDDEFWIGGVLGYQRGRLFGADGDLTTPVNVFIGSVEGTWQMHDQLGLVATFQHLRQETDTTRPPLPFSFTRNVFLVGARFTVPSDEDLPPTYRTPLRVDRADEVRFRDEGFPANDPRGIAR